MSHGFTVFETPIGPCSLVWRGRSVAGVQLPEADGAATRARVRQRFPEATEGEPPRTIDRVTQAVLALLSGKKVTFAGIDLDMQGVPPFHRRVYELARTIPPGTTLSYGEVAARLGAPGAARAVGQALRKNPFAIIVPCHRVVAAGGKLGGFTANGGVSTKLRLLALEGLVPEETRRPATW